MASNDVIAPSWKESVPAYHFQIIVPIGYRLTGLERVARVEVLVVTGVCVGVWIGSGGGTVGVVWSRPRIDWRVEMADARSR